MESSIPIHIWSIILTLLSNSPLLYSLSRMTLRQHICRARKEITCHNCTWQRNFLLHFFSSFDLFAQWKLKMRENKFYCNWKRGSILFFIYFFFTGIKLIETGRNKWTKNFFNFDFWNYEVANRVYVISRGVINSGFVMKMILKLIKSVILEWKLIFMVHKQLLKKICNLQRSGFFGLGQFFLKGGGV